MPQQFSERVTQKLVKRKNRTHCSKLIVGNRSIATFVLVVKNVNKITEILLHGQQKLQGKFYNRVALLRVKVKRCGNALRARSAWALQTVFPQGHVRTLGLKY
jgi:hypothetical protein